MSKIWATFTPVMFGASMAIPTWPCYIDFTVYPLLAFSIIALNCRSLEWVGLFVFGVLLFTFIEYWLHRVVLHRWFFKATHERHHTHPKEYVVFPIWYLPPIFLAFYFVLPLAVFAGFIVGYCWFLYWHHWLHHIDLKRWPRPVQRYATWHLGHHQRDDYNFGIVVPIWDFLFGTNRQR